MAKLKYAGAMSVEDVSVRIRKLGSSDRDDILEISRHIWEGHDYLPSVFELWLKDRNSHFYGVEEEGRVVAVANLHLIEDRRTGWMEGLRVHPDYRGRGYAKAMTRFIIKKANDLNLQRLRYTTGDNNAASLKLASMAGFQRLLEKTVFWCVKPKKVVACSSYIPIEESQPRKVFELLSTNLDFVPREVLVFDWKALDVTLENLEEIGRDHKFFVALKNGQLDSMSFGHSRQDLEKTWGFTIHAQDSKGFLAQLEFSMKRALDAGANWVMSTFGREFEEKSRQVDFQCEEQDVGHLVLFEKQLKCMSRSK